jgi:hypothetical protein
LLKYTGTKCSIHIHQNDIVPERRVNMKHAGGGGAVYGLGFVGAAVYFIQHAASFSDGVFGVLKAMVWPALVVYHVVGLLKI